MTVDERDDHDATPTIESIDRCFGGAIPAVLCTASGTGVPNVTFVSRAHRVDNERIALSNQFLSKTARNLVDNPRADLLLLDPVSHEEFRLTLAYERTERRGRVFERLRADIDTMAAAQGLEHVFRLRAADIFRVVEITRIEPNREARSAEPPPARSAAASLAALAELVARMSRATDTDVLVDTVLEGLDRLLGYEHVFIMLLDEEGHRLYTIGSRGFDEESVGAEVVVGDGLIGMAAARCEPVRFGDLWQLTKYSASVRREYEASGELAPGREVPMPGLAGADSRVVVPAMALGQLVGIIVVDRIEPVAFGTVDEHVLGVVASVLANAIEHARALERDEEPVTVVERPPAAPAVADEAAVVRFFPVDGSTFLDGDYLIKGVAGRILWSLLRQHVATGRVEFTNKELRLDPTLDLPGFKDNLESRLLLLKRRLDEHHAPLRIERTGRGRFRLSVDVLLRLEPADV